MESDEANKIIGASVAFGQYIQVDSNGIPVEYNTVENKSSFDENSKKPINLMGNLVGNQSEDRSEKKISHINLYRIYAISRDKPYKVLFDAPVAARNHYEAELMSGLFIEFDSLEKLSNVAVVVKLIESQVLSDK